MESVIAKLLQDFEQGKMNRRQLIQSLSLAAAAAAAIAPAARAAGKPLEALYVNHISYEVNDYKKVRDFYVDQVTHAAQALKAERFLLDEDVQRYVNQAQAANVP